MAIKIYDNYFSLIIKVDSIKEYMERITSEHS